MTEPKQQADTQAEKPSVYSIIGDRAFRLDPKQAREMVSAGLGDSIVSQPEALQAQQARMDAQLAEEAGGGWAAAGGLLSGGTFGFGPAAAISVKEAIDGKRGGDYLRHLFAGQRGMGAYQAANVAGMLGTTYVTGGLLNPLESKAASLLPEATGVLGHVTKGALVQGGRLGAEGAIMGLGSAVEEAAIQNRPLAAEAALHGVMFGGGLGAVLGGGVGAASGFVHGVGNKIGPILDKMAANAAPAIERNMLNQLGATNATMARIASEDGGISAFLKEADEMAQREGARLSSNPQELYKVAEKNAERFAEQRIDVAREFDSANTGVGPAWHRFEREVIDGLIGDVAQTPGGIDRAQRVASWLRRMASIEEEVPEAVAIKSEPTITKGLEDLGIRKEFPKLEIPGGAGQAANDITPTIAANDNALKYMAANDNALTAANDNAVAIRQLVEPTGKTPQFLVGEKAFEGWAAGRQYVRDALGSLPEDLQSKVLHLYDAEMRSAMEAAEAADSGLAGAAGRYQAAEVGQRVSAELRDMLENRMAQQRGWVRPDDAGVVAAYAMSGHPLGGAMYAAGRIGARALEDIGGPKMAEAMWRMSNGGNAAAAVGELKASVDKAMRVYLRARETATSVAVKGAAQKRTRASYEKEVDKVYKLMARPRDERLQEYLRHTGNLVLAEEMAKKSDQVIKVLNESIPPSRKTTQQVNIRKTAVPHTLDVNEHKFLNKVHIIKSPYGALDSLKKGNLTRDQVMALKESWPETYNLVVETAQKQVQEMAAEGKKLPASKIAQMSILLDYPLDSIMESKFIQPVQQALNAPAQQGPKPQPSGPAPAFEDNMTPVEQIVGG